MKDECFENVETFPAGALPNLTSNNESNHSRSLSVPQGQYLHQITLGASGQEPYSLCNKQMAKSDGQFYYSTNAQNGFSLVTVDENEFNIQIKGVDHNSQEPSVVISDLYTVTIKR